MSEIGVKDTLKAFFLVWKIGRTVEPSVMMEKARDRAYLKGMRSSILDMLSLMSNAY